VRWQIYLVN